MLSSREKNANFCVHKEEQEVNSNEMTVAKKKKKKKEKERKKISKQLGTNPFTGNN